MEDELIKFYLERSERAFKGREAAVVLEDVRAIVGPSSLPSNEMGELAQQGLDALRNLQRPTPIQLGALEVIIRLMRPVPLSVGGELDDIDDEIKPDYAHWESFKKDIKPYIYSIGRINLTGGDAVGTGFLVSDDLIVTNNHVLDQLSHGTRLLEKGQAFINFGSEWNTTEAEGLEADITDVEAFHDSLDIALLRIDKPGAGSNPLLLPDNPEIARQGQQVVALGYPFNDSRNPLFVQALYEDKFGVKRAAVGEITRIGENTIFHDCSTLGGNSGSPIISMETAEVVGLHRDGYFLYRNEAVDGQSLVSFIKEHI